MASIWSPEAVATIIGPNPKTAPDDAVRTAEGVSSYVERRCGLTLVRPAALPPFTRGADSDPIDLPRHWWPNPEITAVKGSAEANADLSAAPELEYDFDGRSRIYSRGGWPARQSCPGPTRAFTSPSIALWLPTVRVEGTAGLLAAPLDENLNIPPSAEFYTSLFVAARDLLQIWLAYRDSGRNLAGMSMETGEIGFEWARRWPQHIREVLDAYADHNLGGAWEAS